jgi:hypothetical protein
MLDTLFCHSFCDGEFLPWLVVFPFRQHILFDIFLVEKNPERAPVA